MNNTQQLNISTNASVTAASKGIALHVVESCIFLFLNITALVGNALVCLAFYRNPSLRTVTNIFILSLALTDLSMAVLTMPLATISTIAKTWIAGDFGCQVFGLCSYTLGGTSLLTVMLLAINRYLTVARPALYRSVYLKKRARAMAASAWIVSTTALGVGFSVVGIRFDGRPNNPSSCFPVLLQSNAFIFYNVVHSAYIIVPSLVIAVCYVKIYQTIRQHNAAGALSSQQHLAYGVEEARITRLLTVVLVAFYLCWLPVFVTIILDLFQVIGSQAEKYENFYYDLPAFTSSAINPLIYATMSQRFRTEFLNILRGQ